LKLAIHQNLIKISFAIARRFENSLLFCPKRKKMMRYFILLFSILAMVSCNSEETGKREENQEIAKLRNELRRLEMENAEKEALIEESLGLFSEIQENVIKIQHKENEIRIISEKGVKDNSQKEWLRQELKNIQFLMEENNRKIKNLNRQLEGKEEKLGNLYQMIESLQEKLVAQDALIQELRTSLANQDQDYSKLFDAYIEQSAIAEAARRELAKAYYVYGSLEELKRNNVIVQTKGFIGIGKKSQLKDGFNEDYFTPIDRFERKKIQIVGKKIQIVSDHPSSSYEIIDHGNSKVINILNAHEFWKIGKYLVVIVE
jgi:DNA repair exonuclease SbcCD ATPase subunit